MHLRLTRRFGTIHGRFIHVRVTLESWHEKVDLNNFLLLSESGVILFPQIELYQREGPAMLGVIFALWETPSLKCNAYQLR